MADINLPAIQQAALRMAGFVTADRANELRWIAKDCQCAMDGCDESAASVEEYLASHDDLDREARRWTGILAIEASAEARRAA